MERKQCDITDPDLSVQELKKQLFISLKCTGILDSLKSQLRVRLLEHLRDQDETLLKSKDIEKKPSITERLLSSLFLDYLTSYGYSFTQSVFLPESRMVSWPPLTNQEILKFLHLDSISKSNHHLKNNLEVEEGKGCLVQQLVMVMQNYPFNIKMHDMGMQTHDLESCLREVDDECSKRKEAERVLAFRTLEDRFNSFRKEFETRVNGEVALQVDRVRENENNVIRMEEASRYRRQLAKDREELEELHKARLERIREREESLMERVVLQERAIEASAYEQRQKFLAEITSLRDREERLKQKEELQERQGKKLEEMENLMKTREEDIGHMQETLHARADETVEMRSKCLEDKYKSQFEKLKSYKALLKAQWGSFNEEKARFESEVVASKHDREIVHSLHERLTTEGEQRKLLLDKLENIFQEQQVWAQEKRKMQGTIDELEKEIQEILAEKEGAIRRRKTLQLQLKNSESELLDTVTLLKKTQHALELERLHHYSFRSQIASYFSMSSQGKLRSKQEPFAQVYTEGAIVNERLWKNKPRRRREPTPNNFSLRDAVIGRIQSSIDTRIPEVDKTRRRPRSSPQLGKGKLASVSAITSSWEEEKQSTLFGRQRSKIRMSKDSADKQTSSDPDSPTGEGLQLGCLKLTHPRKSDQQPIRGLARSTTNYYMVGSSSLKSKSSGLELKLRGKAVKHSVSLDSHQNETMHTHIEVFETKLQHKVEPQGAATGPQPSYHEERSQVNHDCAQSLHNERDSNLNMPRVIGSREAIHAQSNPCLSGNGMEFPGEAAKSEPERGKLSKEEEETCPRNEQLMHHNQCLPWSSPDEGRQNSNLGSPVEPPRWLSMVPSVHRRETEDKVGVSQAKHSHGTFPFTQSPETATHQNAGHGLSALVIEDFKSLTGDRRRWNKSSVEAIGPQHTKSSTSLQYDGSGGLRSGGEELGPARSLSELYDELKGMGPGDGSKGPIEREGSMLIRADDEKVEENHRQSSLRNGVGLKARCTDSGQSSATRINSLQGKATRTCRKSDNSREAVHSEESCSNPTIRAPTVRNTPELSASREIVPEGVIQDVNDGGQERREWDVQSEQDSHSPAEGTVQWVNDYATGVNDEYLVYSDEFSLPQSDTSPSSGSTIAASSRFQPSTIHPKEPAVALESRE